MGQAAVKRSIITINAAVHACGIERWAAALFLGHCSTCFIQFSCDMGYRKIRDPFLGMFL